MSVNWHTRQMNFEITVCLSLHKHCMFINLRISLYFNHIITIIVNFPFREISSCTKGMNLFHWSPFKFLVHPRRVIKMWSIWLHFHVIFIFRKTPKVINRSHAIKTWSKRWSKNRGLQWCYCSETPSYSKLYDL